MRFTLGAIGDLEVPEGMTLGECRPLLAGLTGVDELRTVPLGVDGVGLVDEHVAGAPPWLPGCRVRTGPHGADVVRLATTAAWHLAVVAGPDAGRVAVPGRDGTVVVGRHPGAAGGVDRRGGPAGSDDTGALRLTDPAVSRDHLRVRARHRSRRPRWRAEDVGSANGTTVTRRRRAAGVLGPVRRVGRAGAALRHGDRIRLGDTILELRARQVPRRSPTTEEPAAPHRPTASMLVPLVISGTLAAVTRNPVFLVLAAAGPIATAVPALARRLRRGPRRPATPSLGPDAPTVSVTLSALEAGFDRPEMPDAGWPELAGDGLAVVGPVDRVLAVARALVGSALLDPGLGLTVLHPATADEAWSWCRWLDRRIGTGPAARVARSGADAARVLAARRGAGLVVTDRGAPWRATLDRWWLSERTARDRLLVLESRRDAVPPWCRWVLCLAGEGATLEGPGGSWRIGPPTASPAWAEEHARRVAAFDAARRLASQDRAEGSPDADPPPRRELPVRVGLADLGLPDDVAGLLDRWGGPRPGIGRTVRSMVVTLGVGADGRAGEAPWAGADGDRRSLGQVRVDLLSEGPHALVAGTTGSGKSELLQSLILSLALAHPPTELAMVLVDYKGGTSFGRCSELPHVVGQVTDLGPLEARRALDGLRWELHRRETLLAGTGVADLESLRARSGHAPPRLLVVVDEFRAMTEDLPDFVPGLVRLAAQGRSLGIHLVLATQRPAGAISAQMRANLALRICLRVTETADSCDVVETPDAAALPVGVPGRAVLRRGPGPVELVQTAWAALPPSSGHRAVTWAADWSASGRPEGSRANDHCDHLVRIAHAAVRAAGLSPPRRVWLPPLPPTVRAADLPATGPPPLGLTDPPGAMAWGTLTWAGTGLLLVAGRGASGRTTALATVTRGALARGTPVHVVGGTEAALATITGVGVVDGAPVGPGGTLGTVVTCADPRRLARLLTVLLTERSHPRLLVIDDVDLVVRALDRLPRGIGSELWDRVLREGRHQGLALVVAGAPPEASRLLAHASERLVLAVNDAHDDVLLGVPRDLAGARERPGRGVHLGPSGAVRCQVALPPVHPVPVPVPLLGPSPVRIAALPLRPTYEQLAEAARPRDPDHPLVGLGGDGAGPVGADIRGGLLVVGPPGSGRSTALAVLAAELRATGRPVLVVARDGPLAVVGEQDPAHHAATVSGARSLLQRAAARTDGAPPVFLVDDLDTLARADPRFDEEVAAWVTAAETGTHAPRIVASARTDRTAAAFRGACAALRAGASLVVLSPAEPGSADVAGTDLGAAVDPASPRHRGRGALVHRGRVTALQVPHAPLAAGAAPTTPPSTATRPEARPPEPVGQ